MLSPFYCPKIVKNSAEAVRYEADVCPGGHTKKEESVTTLPFVLPEGQLLTP